MHTIIFRDIKYARFKTDNQAALRIQQRILNFLSSHCDLQTFDIFQGLAYYLEVTKGT